MVKASAVLAEQLPGHIYSHVNGHLDQHRFGFFSPGNSEEHFYISIFFSDGGCFQYWFINWNKKSKATSLHVKMMKEIVGIKQALF